MLYGKKIVLLQFIVTVIVALLCTNANALSTQEKETKTHSFTKINTIKFPTEEFKQFVGDTVALSTIQAYIDIDDRIEEADKILGLSAFIQQTPKNIKQIDLNINLDEQILTKTQENTTYKINKIIDNELIDETDDTLFARQIEIEILKISEKMTKDSSAFAEIHLTFFAKDKNNRYAQYTFINNLRNYSISHFPFIKGPETLGMLSAKDKHFESHGELWWVYYNSYFRMESHHIPEQDVIQIAQWVYDHIKFTFTE